MIWQILGLFFLLIGVFFSLAGILGNIRFPDVYSRIHASGKVSSLGVISFLISGAFLFPEVALKALALGLLLLLAAPISAHAIALAAHRQEASLQVEAEE